MHDNISSGTTAQDQEIVRKLYAWANFLGYPSSDSQAQVFNSDLPGRDVTVLEMQSEDAHGDESKRAEEVTETSIDRNFSREGQQAVGVSQKKTSGSVTVTDTEVEDSIRTAARTRNDDKIRPSARNMAGRSDETDAEKMAGNSTGEESGSVNPTLDQNDALGSATDETVLPDTSASKNVPSESSVNDATERLQSDRKEMSLEKENSDKAKQKEIDDQNKLRAILEGTFSGNPLSSAGQKKAHETLATHRWKKAYEFVKKTNVKDPESLSLGTCYNLR
ncbi:hypothetical protein R1flu_010759 [Riccia fluitans]|uniref:Uncharacterized protein n=1 Tax=Riccia fluitans TaxID=41844 RepID=A0ABD1ZA20_9MARC